MTIRGYLAVQGVRWPEGVGSVELAPNVHAGASASYSLPTISEDDRRAHGELSMEPFDNPNLVIWTERPGTSSGRESESVLDSISRDLGWCSATLSMAISTAAVTSFSVIESVNNQERVVRRTRALVGWLARGTPGRASLLLDTPLWQRISVRVMPILTNWTAENEQTTHAVRSFFRACEMEWVDDRYELFCRSVETVLQTEIGRGAKQFADGVRMVLIGNKDTPSEQELIEHYQRRNDIVHGHRFLDPDRGDGDPSVRRMEDIARGFMQSFLSDDAIFQAVTQLQRQRVTRKAPTRGGG